MFGSNSIFSDDQIAVIKLLAHQEAQNVLIDTMKGMATVSGSGSQTSSGESTVIISRSFDNPNPETMDAEINAWLEHMQAVDVYHMDSVKNPNANFGMIKTIYIKVPRHIAQREEQKPF